MRNPCLLGAFFFAPNAVFLRFGAFRWWQAGAADTIGEAYAVRTTEETRVTCSALHVLVQHAAIADAVHCDGRCTALRHLPRNTAGWRAVPSARQHSRLLRAGAAFLWSDRCLWASAPLPLGNVGWAGGPICPVPCVGRWGRLPRRMRCAACIWPLCKKTPRKAKNPPPPPYLYVNQIQ